MLSLLKDQTLNHCSSLDCNSHGLHTTFLHFPKALPQLDPSQSLPIDAILKGTVKLIDLRLDYILHKLYLFYSIVCID